MSNLMKLTETKEWLSDWKKEPLRKAAKYVTQTAEEQRANYEAAKACGSTHASREHLKCVELLEAEAAALRKRLLEESAPELLDALKFIAYGPQTKPYSVLLTLGECVEHARAAIAKVEVRSGHHRFAKGGTK